MPETLPFRIWLKERRKALDLTQADLAARIHYSVQMIEKLEAGARRPSKQVAARLAAELGISPAEQDTFILWARGPLDPEAVEPSRRQVAQLPAPVVAPTPPLPAPLTSFVGRAQETAAVTSLLRQATVRLVTLTGAPGIGKTRLALHIAGVLHDAFAHGVAFIPLAALRDPDLVLSTITGALSVAEVAGQPTLDSLTAYLRSRQMLLVLDNFEQVLTATGLLHRLLEATGGTKLLVTSRAVLGVYGEHIFPVPPLSLPDPVGGWGSSSLADSEAVQLFMDRAKAATSTFVPVPTAIPVVAEICIRLEGLPLAIELAAARSRLLSPHALLARLEHRLAVLTGGPQDRPERQQTLRGAIAWSYDLLSPVQQILFARLSVFVGGGSAAAAAAVSALAGDGSTDPQADLIALLDQSLLRQDTRTEEELRFSMLETIREYAAEQLAARAEVAPTRRQHAAYYLALAESAEGELRGPAQGMWLARLELEHDNLRAALGWALEQADVAHACRISSALWRFWFARGHLREGRRWLSAALALDGAAILDPVLRAKTLQAAGALARILSAYDEATGKLTASLALYEALGDATGQATTLYNLGMVATHQGAYDRAVLHGAQSLDLYQQMDDHPGMIRALHLLATATLQQGTYAQSRAYCEECLRLARATEHQRAVATAISSLGEVERAEGHLPRAAALYTESLALFRQLGDKVNTAIALHNLGQVAQQQQDFDQATALLTESLALNRDLGEQQSIATCLAALAAVAAGRRQPVRAARLFGATHSLLAATGAHLYLPDQVVYDRNQATTQALLGPDAWAVAWAAGAALSLEQVVAYALASDEDRAPGD
jgi:predicted ATPase/transcriptional regulator with XRE-family HTH domain